jgi:hypothetical protein
VLAFSTLKQSRSPSDATLSSAIKLSYNTYSSYTQHLLGKTLTSYQQMAAESPQGIPRMAWWSCPTHDMQDGVCGCPDFWGREATPNQSHAETGSSKVKTGTQLILSSETSPGLPQETCFFWYHGDCLYGDQCPRAHELHVTWPIAVPPRMAHRKPCDLPLCPLRPDFVQFMRKQQQEKRKYECDIPPDVLFDEAVVSHSRRSTLENP